MQASAQSRDTRVDMLQMAKELISLHAFVDDTMATLDAIAHAHRLQRGASERQEHVAALQAQGLELSLHHTLTQLDEARRQAASIQSGNDLRSLKERSHEVLTLEMLSSALDRPVRQEMAALQASAFAAASEAPWPSRPNPLTGSSEEGLSACEVRGRRARGGLGPLVLGPVWQAGLILTRSSADSSQHKTPSNFITVLFKGRVKRVGRVVLGWPFAIDSLLPPPPPAFLVQVGSCRLFSPRAFLLLAPLSSPSCCWLYSAFVLPLVRACRSSRLRAAVREPEVSVSVNVAGEGVRSGHDAESMMREKSGERWPCKS